MTTFTFTSAIIESSLAFLSWSSLLCICISVNDIFANESITQNFRCLYEQHQQNQISQKCAWFVQAKRAQKNYLMRKHESKIKNKLKEKMKQLTKQKKKARLIKKRAEEYTCKRCKHSIKFDNNIKFHEHIRTRHAKKSKFASSQSIVSFFTSSQSMIFSFSVSSSQSIISSFFASSKLIIKSLATSFSEISSDFSSAATSRKSISWAKIVSRSVTASKFSRLSIATLKSMCKFSKNANVVCSFASSRTFTSSRFYLIVNDLYRMFVEKSSSFDLQSSQNKSLFSRSLEKCNIRSNDFIQTRITSYFNATISFAFKTIKFEAFSAVHASIKQSIRISFSRTFRFSSSMRFSFSTFSRSFSVCRHCQERSVIYRFIDWVMPNVSKVENNEIFMKMRYWRFASFHSALREYWSSRSHYFEEVKTCCLFVLFARSL